MTSNTPSFRTLILGGGAVVAEFHLPAFAQLNMLDRVCVADPSAAALARLAAAFPNVKMLPLDFQSALDDAARQDFQAVLVALPNALHETATARALEMGFDVLCEKPLALTREACARLDELASREKKILAVGMMRRFTPAVQALRRALQDGWIGEIQSVTLQDGSAFAWSSDSGLYFTRENAGVLANIGVHALDQLDYLLGELTPIKYTDDARGGVEANAEFQLATASGAPIQLTLSYTHRLKNQFRICGTLGTLRLDKEVLDRAFFRAALSDLDAVLTLPKPFQYGDWQPTVESIFCEQFRDFQEACCERRAPHATARDATRTAELIDWAYRSHTSPQIHVNAPRFPKRVVVTGATGFVGGSLVEQLCEQGASDILLPVRSYRSGANVGRFPVKMERVDLLNSTELGQVMHGAQTVYHLAFGRDGEHAHRITVDGTRNVIEAAIAQGVERVVVLSTTAVLGDPGGVVDESAAYAPKSAYEKAKAAAEQWTLARAKQETGTLISVINSSCVYGPRGKTFTELPAQLLQAEQFAWIEGGRGIVNYVYAQNLADAMIAAATGNQAQGERFIVSDGAMTWREFFTALLGQEVENLASYTPQELRARAYQNAPGIREMMRAMARNPEMWRIVRENPRLKRAKELAGRVTPSLYRRVQDSRQSAPSAEPVVPVSPPPVWLADLYGATTTRLSAAKAQRELLWTPRVTFQEGIAASRAWLREIQVLDEGA